MQTVRRLYLYLISGVTLAILAAGLGLLAAALLRTIGVGGESIIRDVLSSTRVQASQAVALIAVGLPVWLVHWWLIERGLRASNALRETERASTVRALYLTLVLSVSLLVGVNSAASLLRTVGHQALGGITGAGLDDVAVALPATVVAALIWLYHWSIHRRDLRAGMLIGAAAWLPRVYLYGVAALGLLSTIDGLRDLIGVAAQRLFPGNVLVDDPGFLGGSLIDAASGTVVWAVIWLGHWWYLGRSVRGDDPRAVSEGLSRVRTAYFAGVIVLAAARAVLDLAQVGGAVLVTLFGAEALVGVTPTASLFVRQAGVPLVTAGIWAAVGWTHLRWFRREAFRPGLPDRAVQVERLQSYGLALTGLAFAAVGLARLLGVLFDAVFGRQTTISGPDAARLDVAQFAPMAILGSALWLWRWRQVVARRAADPLGEATSTTRRAGLLIPIASSILAGLGAAVVLLFQVVAVLLEANVGDPLSMVSSAAGVLIVALLVALYHGLLLRRDIAAREGAAQAKPGADVAAEAGEPGLVAAEPGVVAAEPSFVASEALGGPDEHVSAPLRLILAGPPGSDLEAVVATLRGALPADHSLEEAPETSTA